MKKADQNADGFVTVEEAAAVIEKESRSETPENGRTGRGRPGRPSRDANNKTDEKESDEKKPEQETANTKTS